MNAKLVWTGLIVVGLLAGLVAGASYAQDGSPQTRPSGTGFTYQGRLKDGSGPVTDTCDITFKLYDAASGGTRLGTQTRNSVVLADGYFTVQLDFGEGAFNGQARWLQIGVDCGAGAVTLSPRQELTAAPYALWAADGPFVGAGVGNTISGRFATVGGGANNEASGDWATVAGGESNIASGELATVAGGGSMEGTGMNRASAYGATVGGGGANEASGVLATVAGGELNTASGADATVGGGQDNSASEVYATVGGGEGNEASDEHATVGGGQGNSASEDHATVGGGQENTAGGWDSTVAGGKGNTANGWEATVGGGAGNTASHDNATVAGGYENTAGGPAATVGGGSKNAASGSAATVPGGWLSAAAGDRSFAAGTRAKANMQGCFVWGDSTSADINCSDANRTIFRSSGGYSIYTNAGLTSGVRVSAGGSSWNSVSDRARKENFQALDNQALLEEVAGLEITTWNYTSQDPAIRHIGPMAQDFNDLLPDLGGEGTEYINTLDADGVALAAIQGLYAQNQDLRAQVEDLSARLSALETLLTAQQDASEGGAP